MNFNHVAWKDREAARAAFMDKPPGEPMLMIRAYQGPFLWREKAIPEELAEWYVVRWFNDLRGLGLKIEVTNPDGTLFRPPKAVPVDMGEMDYYV
jgi:hypothetical protein